MCAITLLRNGRHDIPTIVDPRRETRDVALPGLRDRLKVAKFEFRHAATGLLVEQRQRNTVVFENRDQILVNDRVIALAVAGCIQHNLATSVVRRLRVCCRTINQSSSQSSSVSSAF